MAQPSHIFIVGAFRSGTTLLRRTLNSSNDIAICDETHFLGRGFLQQGYRYKFREIGDLSTDEGLRKVVNHIYEHPPRNFWRWIRKNVDQAEFTDKLLASDRSDQALFDVVMTYFADGKPILGEKTPAHIYHVPTLLEWYPQAKVIHTLRDPRAIFVSEQRKKSDQDGIAQHYRLFRRVPILLDIYLSLHILITWLRVVRLHKRYQTRYPNRYFLSRYEDLVSDPETHLRQLCQFLEIEFSPAMLQQEVVNTWFSAKNGQPKEGFDASAIERWRKYLNPMVNRWFILGCRKYLLEFGYHL